MATTLNSSGVTFPDGTTQTTAAGAVMATIAAAAAGAVGTYVFAQGGSVALGSTIAGSSLLASGANSRVNQITSSGGYQKANKSGSSLSGTWRCMGYAGGTAQYVDVYGGYPEFSTLWLRIS